jgi:trigger factor
VEQLRLAVRDQLHRQRVQAAEHAIKDKIVDRLLDMHSFPVPESLVEKQIDTRVDRGLRTLAAQGVDPNKVKLDWGRVRGAEKQAAERDVRTSVLLERIAAKESIEAQQADVEAEVRRIARQLGRGVEDVRLRLSQNGTLDRLKEQIRNEQVLDVLYQSATGVAPFRRNPQPAASSTDVRPATGTEPQP